MGLFGFVSKISGMDKKTLESVQKLEFILGIVQREDFTFDSFSNVMANFGVIVEKLPAGYAEATIPFVEIHDAHIMLNPLEKKLKVEFISTTSGNGSFNRVELLVSPDEKLMIIGEDNHYIKLMAEDLEKAGYQLLVTPEFHMNRR